MESKDMVNSPSHYTHLPIEVIDLMEHIWGAEMLSVYCQMTAFKYRMRVGHKFNDDEDMKKMKWYEEKSKKLLEVKK